MPISLSGRLPLEGLRVLDLSIWVQGPLAAMMLADLGAEVIKVEKPGQGDFARGVQSLFGKPQTLPGGRNLMYEIANRNKRAISVDLRHPQGREAFYRLAKRCDVLVTNLHPAALSEFGVDRETMQGVNPDLIYAHATGFGSRGPSAQDPCQDTTGMARSGFMFNTPAPDGSPTYPVGTLSDVLSGTMLAFGVLTSLLARHRWGDTAGVACSQLSAMMWLQYYSIAQYLNTGDAFPPHSRTAAQNPLMNVYRCQDNKWLACGMFLSERFVWDEFCSVLEMPQLAGDSRFRDDQGRSTHNRELIALLDAAFAKRPRTFWEEVFRQKGYWASVVNNIEDLVQDPQVAANNYLTEEENGVKTVTAPFGLEGLPLPPPRSAPAFGQDTDEILQDLGGYSTDEILELKIQGAIW